MYSIILDVLWLSNVNPQLESIPVSLLVNAAAMANFNPYHIVD